MSAGATAVAVVDADRARRDWLILAAAVVAFGFGFGINIGITPDFTARHLEIPRAQLGLLESLREVPGLLAAGLVGLLAVLPRPAMGRLALAILGVGICCTGLAGSLGPLIAINVFWSIGLHIWLSVQPSLTLSLSKAGHSGFGLGMMNRYMALAMMTGLALVGLTAGHLGHGIIYLIGGLSIIAGSVIVSRLSSALNGEVEHRLLFRREYWRYYLLMLLDGGRRQVVQTFALLILVKEFNVDARGIAPLLVLNQALTMAVSPYLGRLTDRLGERRVLFAYYSLVAVIFLGYTQIEFAANRFAVSAGMLFSCVYVVDSVLFAASVGIQTYIRHVAPPEELAPSIAMGITWNHVAAVSVPLAAGWIWAGFGYQRIFAFGIILALLAALTCLTLPRRGPTGVAPS